MEKNILPDKAAILSHLQFLFSGQTNGFIEIAYTPSNTGAVSKAEFFNPNDIEKAAEFAANQNAVEGVNVYVGAALRKPDIAPFGRSSAEDYFQSTVIWCDLDDAEAAKSAKEKYKDLPPSFVVVTGRHPNLRAQAWWKLETPQNNKDLQRKALAGVCAALDGDRAVVDPARVMRLGGSIAWPKKEGRIPEKTEITTPPRATKAVSFEAFQSYFPGVSTLVDKKDAAPGGVGLNLQNRGLSQSNDEWSIDQICDMLNHINPDSEYIDWLSVGMALKDYGIGFDIWDSWSARGAKYSNSIEMRKKWDSFKGAGVTIGSLYYQAHKGGYHPSKYRKSPISHVLPVKEPEFDPETGEIIEDKKPKARTLPVLYAGDVTPVTDTTDFVEDLLRDNEFSVIYGESNCGKTFFMLDLAMHVALGMKWRDKEVEQGGVIYAALEGGHGTKNRIVAFREHHHIEGDIPLAVIPSNLNFLDTSGDIQALVEAIESAKARLGKVRLIVIDTLARAIAGGDENSSQDMGQLIINADILRGITGAHIAFIHHSGKDALRGARGHSSLRAAVDTEIEISRHDANSPSQIKVVKQREMEMIEEMAFSLKSTVLGVNKRKKEVTSCVVIPAEVVEKKRQVKLTAIQQFVYDALVEALISHGAPRNVMKDHPPINAVIYDDLRLVLENRGYKEILATEDKTTEQQIKTATQSARVALKKHGKINFNKNYLWLENEE